MYLLSNDGYTSLLGPVTFTIVNSYTLLHGDAECNSGDADLGNQDTVIECAAACAAETGCKYFIYGKGGKATYCSWEKTGSAACSEGWNTDSYDFYQTADLGTLSLDSASISGASTGSVTATYQNNGDSGTGDWLAIYNRGGLGGGESSLQWAYLRSGCVADCQTSPGTASRSGSITFDDDSSTTQNHVWPLGGGVMTSTS
jgi:hypothetical protein